jgi:hypothetical protein
MVGGVSASTVERTRRRLREAAMAKATHGQGQARRLTDDGDRAPKPKNGKGDLLADPRPWSSRYPSASTSTPGRCADVIRIARELVRRS